MASQKHRKALLDSMNGKEVPIETTPQEVLSLTGVEGSLHPLLAFFDEDLPLKGATHTRPLQSPLNVWVPRFPWFSLTVDPP